jgi:tetratricopeptide (TPR) repeat protein
MGEFADALDQWRQPPAPIRKVQREPIHEPCRDVQPLALLRACDWKVDRARSLAEKETDPSRKIAYRLALTWLTHERGPAEEGSSWQTTETGPLAGWRWVCEALYALQSRNYSLVRTTLEHAAENAVRDAELRAAVAHLRGAAAFHQGHTATAWADLCEAIEGFGPDHFLTGRVLDTFGMLCAARCQGPATREFYLAAQRLKEQFGDEAGLALTRGQLGRLALDLDELDQADLHFRAGVKECRKIGDVRGQAQQTNHRAQVWLARGQPREALGLLDEAIELAAGKYDVVEGYARKDRAQALVELDRLDEASQECEQAEQRFSRTQFQEGMVHVKRVRAGLLARRGDHAGAGRLLREAAVYFEDAGEEAEAARCLWRLARTLREAPEQQAKADDAFRAAWKRSAGCRRPGLTSAIQSDWGESAQTVGEDQGEPAPFATRVVVGAVIAVSLETSKPGREDAETEWEWRSHLLADLEGVLDSQQGGVVEVSGDGFLALFTGPGHARRALRGALQVGDWLREFNRPGRVMDWPLWQARMGLSTGPVWLGRTGRSDRVERTAGGRAVRQARSLRAVGSPHAPCCDDATREAGEGMVFLPRTIRGEWDVFPAGHATRSTTTL